jgi:large subunit ribosomal protein L31
MQKNIHPAYEEIKVTCSCGNTFSTRSTIGRDLHLEICSKCHPFYTGNQKIIDSAGRVERFRKKYEKRFAVNQPAPVAEKAPAKAAKKPAAKKATAKKSDSDK